MEVWIAEGHESSDSFLELPDSYPENRAAKLFSEEADTCIYVNIYIYVLGGVSPRVQQRILVSLLLLHRQRTGP